MSTLNNARPTDLMVQQAEIAINLLDEADLVENITVVAPADLARAWLAAASVMERSAGSIEEILDLPFGRLSELVNEDLRLQRAEAEFS